MNRSGQQKALVRESHVHLIRELRKSLHTWFRDHGRDFPWRRETDPFRILVSEMLLQRTHACQVASIYENIFPLYDSPKKLAKANEDTLKNVLFPLGMKSRVPRLVDTARTLFDRYEGITPNARRQLKELSGVGDYISGVVMALAFGKGEWFVDGNVIRIMKRYLGIKTHSDDYRNSYLIECMKIFMRSSKPKISAMAIIDFGALVCIPAYPKCATCPLVARCSHSRNPTAG